MFNENSFRFLVLCFFPLGRDTLLLYPFSFYPVLLLLHPPPSPSAKEAMLLLLRFSRFILDNVGSFDLKVCAFFALLR